MTIEAKWIVVCNKCQTRFNAFVNEDVSTGEVTDASIEEARGFAEDAGWECGDFCPECSGENDD